MQQIANRRGKHTEATPVPPLPARTHARAQAWASSRPAAARCPHLPGGDDDGTATRRLLQELTEVMGLKALSE